MKKLHDNVKDNMDDEFITFEKIAPIPDMQILKI